MINVKTYECEIDNFNLGFELHKSGRVSLINTRPSEMEEDNEFIFMHSKPELLEKFAKALGEITEYAKDHYNQEVKKASNTKEES